MSSAQLRGAGRCHLLRAPASRKGPSLPFRAQVRPKEGTRRRPLSPLLNAGRRLSCGQAGVGRGRPRGGWRAVACLSPCPPPADALLRRHQLHGLVPGAGGEHSARPLLHGELPGLRAQRHHPAVENGEAASCFPGAPPRAPVWRTPAGEAGEGQGTGRHWLNGRWGCAGQKPKGRWPTGGLDLQPGVSEGGGPRLCSRSLGGLGRGEACSKVRGAGGQREAGGKKEDRDGRGPEVGARQEGALTVVQGPNLWPLLPRAAMRR